MELRCAHILFLSLWFYCHKKSFRGWTGTGEAGAWQSDAVREVYGTMNGRNSWIYVNGTGPLATTGSVSYYLAQLAEGGAGAFASFDFRLSRSVPTGPVTVPPHVWQPVILYLGNPS